MVFVFGSCLYEIMFKNGRPEWLGPGGSALNVSVSLSRSGNPVHLITELANDTLSHCITDFLDQNKISYDCKFRYDGNTRLSLAFVNDSGDARYTFYPGYPEKAPKLDFPEIKRNDLAFFGSAYSLPERNRQHVDAFIRKSREVDAFLMFDPNYRKTGEMFPYKERIREIISQVNLVRASDEDMFGIAGATTYRQAYDFIRESGGNHMIYTKNRLMVALMTPYGHKEYRVPPIHVQSTIGAGDAFNAGLLSFIHQNGKIEQNIEFWDKAIERGLIFAAEVCGSRENYIGRPL